ncbi:manganese efflux pump MntP family protein [Moraxella sp. ZJ142]|uniref:manganese efflux pump MntP n=1 Tax=Moraxella marmotae TaxID=3344520 RepID=UPI0035D40693
MSLIALVLLAFGMSMDAFSAAIAKGAMARKVAFVQAFKQGAVFGLVEATAPLIGWLLGRAAYQWIQDVDHWIAFGLLSFLGVRCIYQALYGQNRPDDTERHAGFWLIITAVATSIDAMVVGITLAFLAVNIWLAALLIGLVTTMMATAGLLLGQRLGAKFGKNAMMAGGVMLIFIGAYILYSHLMG